MTSHVSGMNPDLLPVILEALGWGLKAERADIAQAWYPKQVLDNQNFNDSPYIIVPLKGKMSGEEYNSLIDRAYSYLKINYPSSFDSLYEFEEINQCESLDSIANRADTGTKSGLIKWQEGKELFDGTKELLLSSAKAADRRKAYFGNAASVVAEEVLNKSYLGQTRIGSYIVTAYVPAYQQFAITRSSDTKKRTKNNTVTGRDITNSMSDALNALNESIKDVKNHRNYAEVIFTGSVQSGVSYELVDSVSKMVKAGPSVKAATVSIQFKPKRPEQKAKVKYYELRNEDLPIFNVAKKVLRTKESSHQTTLEGEVVLLQHSSKTNEHEIKLITIRNKKLIHVRVNMSGDQYKTALQAHEQELQLRITGKLVPQTRGYQINNPTVVAIGESRVN